MDIKIKVQEVVCPCCGAEETHPADAGKPVFERRLLIRGFKVCDKAGHWWSQCLVCSRHYDADLNEVGQHDPKKGWF